MLRARLGDEEVKAFLRDFFTNYQGKTATTADFERLAVIRDPSLASFFDYWLREPALPGFQVNWSPKKAGDQWRIRGRVRQTRPYLSTPITLRLTFRNLEPLDTTIDIEGRNTSFEVMAPAPPSGLELDPEFEILHYSVAVDKK
jgi:aminopeptidase N